MPRDTAFAGKIHVFSNNFAISSGGIGEALQRSAAALATAGNSLEESIGLVVAANDVIQNPEVVGTSLKTLSMFYRSARTEAEEAGIATDGMAESTAKLREELLALTGNKLDIQIDDHHFKSTFQVLQELSEIWDDIGKHSEINQSRILEMLGGKRNANVLASIIKNFNDALAASETAGKSAGSAWAENEKYLNSIEGKAKQVEAAFQTFANNIINSDIVKAFLDIQKAILDAGNALNSINLLLPTIAASLTVIKGIMDSMKAQNAADQILSKLRSGITYDSDSVQDIISGLTKGQLRSLSVDLNKVLNTDGAVQGLKEVTEQITKTVGVTTTFKGAIASIGTTAKTVISGIKASLMSAGIASAIALAISGIIKGIQWIAQANQRAIDAAQEINDAYNENVKTYNDNISSLEKLRNEYDELNAKAGKHGEQGNLTANEYKRYKEIIQEIVNISPSVAKSYSTEGAALKDYTNVINEAIDAQKELIEVEKIALVDKGETTYNGARAAMEEVWREFNSAGKELYSALSTKNPTFDFGGYSEQLNTLKDVLHAFNIEISGSALFDGSGDAFTQFFKVPENFKNLSKNIINIRNALSAATNGAGERIFSDDDVDRIIGRMSAYNELTTKYNAKTAQVVETLRAFAETSSRVVFPNRDDMNIDQLNAYNEGVEDLADTQKSFAQQKDDVVAYTAAFSSAVAEIQKLREQYGTVGKDGKIEFGENTDEMVAALTSLRTYLDELGTYPAIVAMIDAEIENVSRTVEDNAKSAGQAAKSYAELAKSMSDIDKAISFLQNVRDGSSKSAFDMIKQAQEFADLMNAAGGDVNLDNLFDVGKNGELAWDVGKVNDLTEGYIRLKFANTELANEHPEVIDALVEQALAMKEATEQAISFSNALSAISNANDIKIAVEANGEISADDQLKYIEKLQGFVDDWNKIRDANDQIDLEFFVGFGEAGINFEKTGAAVEEYRKAMLEASPAMQALETKFPGILDYLNKLSTESKETAESIITVSDAMSGFEKALSFKESSFDEDQTPSKVLSDALDMIDEYNKAVEAGAFGADAAKLTLEDIVTIDENGISRNLDQVETYVDKMIELLIIKIPEDKQEAARKQLKTQWNNITADVKEATFDLSDAMSGFSKALSFKRSGFNESQTQSEILEDAINMMDEYNKAVEAGRLGLDAAKLKLTDLVTIDENGFSRNYENVETYVDKMIELLTIDVPEEDLEEARNALRAEWDGIVAGIKEATFEISDAMSGLNAALSFKQAAVNPGDNDNPAKIIEDAISMMEDYNKAVDAGKFGADAAKLTLKDLITIDDKGMRRSLDQIDVYVDKMIELLIIDIPDDEKEEARRSLRAYYDSIVKETEDATDRISTAMSKLSDGLSYLQDHINGEAAGGDLLDTLESFYSLKDKFGDDAKDWNWSDFFEWNGTELVNKTDALKVQVDKLAGEIATSITQSLVEAGEITEDEVDATYGRIVESLVKHTEEAKSAYEELNGIVSKVKNVNTFNESVDKYGKGEVTFIDMLSETLSVADDLGLALEEAFDFSTMQPNVDAMNDALDKSIDDLILAKGYSQEFANQLKAAARAAQQTQSLTDSYKNFKSMAGNAGNYGYGYQLTYDTYNEMVAISPDYLEAVEYVNGVLTINRDKYYEVTEAIAEETAQMALLEAAQRELQIEKLNKKLSTLTDTMSDEYKNTVKEINKLKLEANGYKVLANEISNATNQFERFRNAAGNEETETYMDAKSALKMINDVLYNPKSGIFGQTMLPKFREAVKLLIDPQVDFTDPNWVEKIKAEFESAKDKLNAWFGEGTEKKPQTTRSNMNSFLQNLIGAGYLETWTDNAGKQWAKFKDNLNVEDIAKDFGVTTDAIRAAFQQLERYSLLEFDWEQIDPEYYAELQKTAEALAKNAEEAQAKADQAKKDAEEAQEKSAQAAEELEKAKQGNDEEAVKQAEAQAKIAEANAQKAAQDAKDAEEAAKQAKAELEEKTETENDRLKKSLDELLEEVEAIKTSAIEIDFSNAVESSQSVINNLTKIVELIEMIRGMSGGAISQDNSTQTSGVNYYKKDTAANGGVQGASNVQMPIRITASAGISDTKGRNITTADGKIDIQKLAQEFIPDNYNGNVDLTNRVVIPVRMLGEVGWTLRDDDGNEIDPSEADGWATLFSAALTAGDVESGYDVEYDQNIVINATPILANGDPLEPDSFYGYLEDLIAESTATGKSIQELDAEQWNLVLSVDVVEEGKSVDEAINDAEEWTTELHNLQEEWDGIRFENNFFGDADTLDPTGMFHSLDEDITAVQGSLDTLQSTGNAGVDVDTSNGQKNTNDLTASVEKAGQQIAKVSKTQITTPTKVAQNNVNALKQSVQGLIDKIDEVNKKTISPKTASSTTTTTTESTTTTTTTTTQTTTPKGNAKSGASSANGTSFARGGKTLVGEFGQEMVVDTKSGRWYTVGDNGPEMVDLPKGAIVYDADKTAQLLGKRQLDISGLSLGGGTENNSTVSNGLFDLDTMSAVADNTKKSSEAEEEEVDILEEIKNQFDEMNDLLNHQIEHSNFEYFNAERDSNYHGMFEALNAKAELYRQIYENSMNGVNELIANGATEADEELQELEETAFSAYESMKEMFDEARDLIKSALTEEVDGIQKAYSALSEAADSYNETGTITIDQLQDLMDNGLEYLNLLTLENGQYVVNKDAVNDLVNARKEQLAIETALSYLSRLREALQNGEVETVNSLVDSTNNLTNSTWGMVYANLEAARSEGLTEAQYQTVLANINNLRAMTDAATDDVTESAEDIAAKLKESFDKVNAEIEHYIEHQEQAYKASDRAWNFEGMETALENEISYYKKIADEAQNAINEMKRLGIDDTNESLQAVEKSLWSATDSINDAVDKLRSLRVDALSSEIDSLSSAFNTLKTASTEYYESGAMSIDTFQSILNNGVQYLSLLEKENGQYVLNKDKLQEYLQTRKEQLAIETALKYVSELREAVDNGERERVNKLIDATNGLSSSTWDLVYANAAMLKTSGLSNAQYEQVIENINMIRDLAKSVQTDLSKEEEDIVEKYEDQQDALDRILQFTEDLIRAEAKDRVDAINKEIDAYKEIIKLKKESLEQTRTETSYQEEVAEKVKEIAELQAKADLLSLDTSRTANAERQKLMQDIESKQQELAKKQSDYAYDLQVDELEKESEAYEESRQAEIEAIEESVSSTEKVYQLAIARIRDHWDTLYEDLINWNTEQGSVINQEITDNWERACQAVQKYGSYVAALSGLQDDIDKRSNNSVIAVADIPKYHGGGGVAGDKGKLNDEEVLAVLQKGELVVNQEQKKGLFTVVDFVKELGDRLGTVIGGLRDFSIADIVNPGIVGYSELSAAGVTNNNIVFSPDIDIQISANNIDRSNSRRIGEDLADGIANSLFDRFNARGINIVQRLRQ